MASTTTTTTTAGGGTAEVESARVETKACQQLFANGLTQEVAQQLRNVAAGIVPSRKAGGGKRKRKSATAAAAPSGQPKKLGAPGKSSSALPPISRGSSSSRSGPKRGSTSTDQAAAADSGGPPRPFDPPKFAKIKIPKGSGPEVDMARVESLLSGWGDPDAVNVPDPVTQETALHLACKTDRVQVSVVLLRKGANIEALDEAGRTPLYLAAAGGHLDSVRTLLDAEANMETPNKWGNTPLHVACKGHHQEVVEMLVCLGADLTKTNREGQTPGDLVTDDQFRAWFTATVAEEEARKARRTTEGKEPYEAMADYTVRIAKRNQKKRVPGSRASTTPARKPVAAPPSVK